MNIGVKRKLMPRDRIFEPMYHTEAEAVLFSFRLFCLALGNDRTAKILFYITFTAFADKNRKFYTL